MAAAGWNCLFCFHPAPTISNKLNLTELRCVEEEVFPQKIRCSTFLRWTEAEKDTAQKVYFVEVG